MLDGPVIQITVKFFFYYQQNIKFQVGSKHVIRRNPSDIGKRRKLDKRFFRFSPDLDFFTYSVRDLLRNNRSEALHTLVRAPGHFKNQVSEIGTRVVDRDIAPVFKRTVCPLVPFIVGTVYFAFINGMKVRSGHGNKIGKQKTGFCPD